MRLVCFFADAVRRGIGRRESALVRVSARRIKVAMASACPAAHTWGCAAANKWREPLGSAGCTTSVNPISQAGWGQEHSSKLLLCGPAQDGSDLEDVARLPRPPALRPRGGARDGPADGRGAATGPVPVGGGPDRRGKLQVQPCPQCPVSDGRPEKGGLSLRAQAV